MTPARAAPFLAALLAIVVPAAAVRGEPAGEEVASAEFGTGSPVVVELFTSQGCASCPPADELLAELAGHDDVLALGLHVDYWDYIGWADAFASPAHTARQKGYAAHAGERMIYTPQMVVGGQDRVVGNKPGAVLARVEAHREARERGAGAAPRLLAAREGDHLMVRASPGREAGPFDVHVVRWSPGRTVSVLSGENAGQVLDYRNVVTSWDTVGTWDGRSPLELTVPFGGERPGAVLLQRPGPGAIAAAARVD